MMTSQSFDATIDTMSRASGVDTVKGTRAIGAGLFVALLLAACGESSPAAPAPSEPAGTWSGTVTHRWSQTVEQSGEGTRSAITQTYEATVQVSSTQADIGAWELTGQATVKASFDSDYESRLTTPLGPCNTHYTDKVPLTTFSGAVEGGLEIVEGFYQFHVSIPGFDGAISTAVRDDTGCAGGNTTETNPWPVAPVTVGGNGNVTSPSVISGSTIRPVDNGEDVTTWNLTRD